MTKAAPSLFISFEGMEGAGKSTQMKRLAKALKSQGFECIITKEPGGTPLGIKLRNMLLHNKEATTHPFSDLCLFTADRLEHINQVIKPALREKKIVICDRFTDSTLAYQVGGQQLELKAVESLINLSDIKPDLTFLLDLDPEAGLVRVSKRGVIDRYEKKGIAFHKRVRAMYHKLAKAEPNRFVTINTQESAPDATHQHILKCVLETLLVEA